MTVQVGSRRALGDDSDARRTLSPVRIRVDGSSIACAFAPGDRREGGPPSGQAVVEERHGARVHPQTLLVDRRRRAAIKGQKAAVVWLTGLPGSGKSTIANAIEWRLVASGHHTMLLDGDNLRSRLNSDLDFSCAGRVENVRRVGEVARLFVEAGLIVICALISPFAAERDLVRRMVGDGEFVEVFVDAPLEVCIERDPKGLYAAALAGEIKNFTGIGAGYERPVDPEITVVTCCATPDEAADHVVSFLTLHGLTRP